MKGILFKPDMIKVIAEGRKTVTRRLGNFEDVNDHPNNWLVDQESVDHLDRPLWSFRHVSLDLHRHATPRFRPGETVYVKEAWVHVGHGLDCLYKADPQDGLFPFTGKWESPLFMPQWATRTFLQITDVRPERLQEITDEEAIAEGVQVIGRSELNDLARGKFIQAYRTLWDSINPKHPWAENCWVWRIEFKMVKPS